MWPTDRVRVCVKEFCRINRRPYLPVTRQEGLVLLAEAAHISVSELLQTNPISYIKAHLDDCSGDPIELIIKMCQMFGPYTYRNLARGALDIIKEEDESVSVSVASSPLSLTIKEERTVAEEISITVEEAVTVTVEEAIPVPVIIVTTEPTNPEKPAEPVEPIKPTEPVQQVQEVSSCCCFAFCSRRKR
jgi:hypothetical protein